MQEQQQVYRTKVDSSGRVTLLVEPRDRHHIAQGDPVAIVNDKLTLRIQKDSQDFVR